MSKRLREWFLWFCWFSGLFHVARRLSRQKLRILCYHGFALSDECDFRDGLFISQSTFAARLATLATHGFNVLPLDEAVHRLHAGTLPPDSVVITMDDGFYGVAAIAADLLEEHSFPATLYMTTYYMDRQNPIYRLAIQYMFWKTREQMFSDPDPRAPVQGVFDLMTPGVKERLAWAYIDLGEQERTEEQRKALCEHLGKLLNVSYRNIEASRVLSLLNGSEAKDLSKRGVNLQLHTHRHRFPPDDKDVALQEVHDNRAALQGIADQPLKHFCYPSGIWHPRQWDWLTKVGIQSATTCDTGLNDTDTPTLGLKRFLDGENLSEIEFKAELFGFSELMRKLRSRLSFRTSERQLQEDLQTGETDAT